MVQKIYSKMYLVSCTNNHCDVTDSVNHGMVKNTKTWILWEQNIIFLRNKKVLNLCLRWHNLRSYHFVLEVTFKVKKSHLWWSLFCLSCTMKLWKSTENALYHWWLFLFKKTIWARLCMNAIINSYHFFSQFCFLSSTFNIQQSKT